MRPILAILLSGILLIPMPTAQALHEDEEPFVPAEEPSHAFREAIYDLNRTIRDVEERHGEHPKIDEAKNKRALAAQAFVAGNHWLTLHHILEATAVIEHHNTWQEKQGATDREAAYFNHMNDKWQEAHSWIGNVHDRLERLEDEGVDLWMLDHALLAGSILTKGERLNNMWGTMEEAWDRGERGDQVRNMLAASSYGAIMHAQLAEGILDRAERNATDEPVGPIVGSHTLRGIMDSLEPMLANGSVSIDRDFNRLISTHIAEENWLAAMGGTVAWTEQQAPAAVQHAMQSDGDPPFQPDDVIDHLFKLDAEDETLQGIEELGVPGASAKYSLVQVRGTTTVLEERTQEDENVTWDQALQAGEGLGALSAAHTSLAILQVANGDAPPDRVIHLPTHSAGAMDLDENQTEDAGETEDDSLLAVPAGGWLVLLSVGLLAAVVYQRHRRR